MQALLANRLAPITHEFGFLDCEISTAVDAYLKWQTPIQAKRSISLETSATHGNLEEVLRKLLPLTSVEARRFLLIPTASPWMAFFDNGQSGTDAFPPLSYLAQTIGCHALRIVYVPDESLPKALPTRVFEMYGPEKTDWLNVVRTLALSRDKRWSFIHGGQLQPFEQPERYNSKIIKDRFTPEMLDAYVRALGVRAFDETFYRAEQSVLLSKVGPTAPNLREFGLH